MDAFRHLVDVVARLRGEGGCDWDRAQTPETLRGHLLEEAFEVVDAIDHGRPEALKGELGDVLFLLVLLARMHEERGDFGVDDVARGAADKMVRRHPHVFAGAAERPAWEAAKAAERPAGASALDGVPPALPALLRAWRVGQKASRVGFDWPDLAGVRAKVDEELDELDEAIASGDAEHVAEELGDLLFTLVNLARFTHTPPEDALRAATAKFERRFRAVEQACLAAGRTVVTTDAETLERLWRRVKESP
jgi:MazG family protein